VKRISGQKEIRQQRVQLCAEEITNARSNPAESRALQYASYQDPGPEMTGELALPILLRHGAARSSERSSHPKVLLDGLPLLRWRSRMIHSYWSGVVGGFLAAHWAFETK